jgi:crotonobetainyl-CoA:carnitine CoA-transferase CaiB-like acyl-CoA transferase
MAETLSFEEFCRDVFDPKKIFSKPEPLKGTRFLSCTQYILGPSCANYLAELGAEVIKIELPRRGEPMRHTTPFNEPKLYPLSKQMPEMGTGLGFYGANHNEYFLSVDFHKPEGQAIVKMLASKCDGVVENYRAGTFDRWGIGYRQLSQINPRIIYQWLGGFGGWGPGRKRASYDILGQAQGGCFSVTGWPLDKGGLPSKQTIWIMDYWGGMMGAFQVLACMYWRDNISGLGNFMEYSQVQGAQRHLSDCIALFGRYGLVAQRWGNWDTLLSVHGIIKCGKSSYPDSKNPQEMEEGFILVSAYTDADYAKLMRLIKRDDLATKYSKHDERIKAESQYEIYPAIEAWAKDKTKEQVRDILTKEGINNQPVWNSKEVSNQEHFHLRGELEWLDDPTYGEVQSPGPAFHLSETPPRHKWAFKPVGADNEYILGKLCGFSKTKIEALEADAII